jgi:hypothetical protein
LPPRRSALLDALEAGEPVTLQSRQLRGHSLPDVPLRRDQAFDWFEVRPDDSVRAVAANARKKRVTAPQARAWLPGRPLRPSNLGQPGPAAVGRWSAVERSVHSVR